MKNYLTERHFDAAEALADLLAKMAPDYGRPCVREESPFVLIAWDGPFEWAPSLTGGSDLYAGEIGNYSSPNSWYKEFEAIEKKFDVYFECQNSWSLIVNHN